MVPETLWEALSADLRRLGGPEAAQAFRDSTVRLNEACKPLSAALGRDLEALAARMALACRLK